VQVAGITGECLTTVIVQRQLTAQSQGQHVRVRVEHHSIVQMYHDASADTEIRVEKKISNDRLHNFRHFH